MEGILLIAVIGLGLALAAALVALRRRAEELDRLVAAAQPPSGAAPSPADWPSALPLDPPAEDLLPVGVLRIDGSHRIAAATERAQLVLQAAGPLAGRSLMEAFRDARVEAALDAIPDGGTTTFEHRIEGTDPRTLIVRAHRAGAADLVVAVEDVTELRRLQQIRTEFIDNLGHELRTPLSTVTLLSETLAREAEAADVPPRMKERIERIEVETGHLAQMVAEMLDLARIEGGSQLRLDDDVDLGRLAEASTDRLRLFAERNGVTLVNETEADLPAIRGDEARLGQVVVNLVHNAVKFSPEGGEVRVAVHRTGDGLALSVADHGIGIKRADRSRIFERFYKADRARVRGGGTGLGLAIARHVVEGHGGRISVDSEEGAGSTFTVALPLATPSTPAAASSAPPVTPAPSAARPAPPED